METANDIKVDDVIEATLWKKLNVNFVSFKKLTLETKLVIWPGFCSIIRERIRLWEIHCVDRVGMEIKREQVNEILQKKVQIHACKMSIITGCTNFR